MPVCAFEAVVVTSTNQPTRVNNVQGATVLAKSDVAHYSTSCEFVLLTNAEYDQISHAVLVGPTVPVAEPFDYSTAGAIWSMAFTFVLGLYLVSKSAGTILSMIRK